MSNTHTPKTETTFLEIEGPADKAALYLSNRGWRIVQVTGTNGCDFRNGTADEYIVELEEADQTSSLEHNLELLTAYHAGDHDHYVKELRQEARQMLRAYASESTGRPTFVLGRKMTKAIDTALADIDKAVWAANFKAAK